MSLKKTKEQLILMLSKDDSKVIALSGKWGTGKTHLWNVVKKESKDDKVKNSLYVSLFGLSTVEQIKRKLIEVAIPGVESHAGTFDVIKNIFKTGVEAASKHYSSLAALNDLNLLLMAPVVLRGRVIVIDDIERKHEKLGINEVLGFIDEYSKQHSSRFVLVLNDDQLINQGNREVLWETFREKVIDQEIRLSTSANEAFTIAIGLIPSKYQEAIKLATISCGLSNIRIIVKIIKATNQILAEKVLEESIQARVVPSIVLFSAIYYRGLDDGPDFKFALNIGNPDWSGFVRERNTELSAEDMRESRWRMLMQELGIVCCDEFEKVLVEFLESGLFEATDIEAIIDRYVSQKEQLEAREAAQAFLKRVFWDHHVNDTQLVIEAATLPNIAGLLDPYTASELDLSLSKLPGGAPIGKAVIDGWIAAFKANKPTDFEEESHFNYPLHAAIKNEFDSIKAKAQANTSLIDVVMSIKENSGWGTLEEVAMRQATAGDFEAAIREMEIDKLRRFMRYMIEMRLQKNTYDRNFGTATERFVEACRTIANDATSPRLAGIVKRLFEGPALALELNPVVSATRT